jgi:hypothetical protein
LPASRSHRAPYASPTCPPCSPPSATPSAPTNRSRGPLQRAARARLPLSAADDRRSDSRRPELLRSSPGLLCNAGEPLRRTRPPLPPLAARSRRPSFVRARRRGTRRRHRSGDRWASCPCPSYSSCRVEHPQLVASLVCALQRFPRSSPKPPSAIVAAGVVPATPEPNHRHHRVRRRLPVRTDQAAASGMPCGRIPHLAGVAPSRASSPEPSPAAVQRGHAGPTPCVADRWAPRAQLTRSTAHVAATAH